MTSFHLGVGAIICSSDQQLFFVQQKDETYPLPQWQLALSVWGGAVEAEDESPEIALYRELQEELRWQPEQPPIFIGQFKIKSVQEFELCLFKIILPKEELEQLAQQPVYEGYGRLLDAESLQKYSWVWDLGTVIYQEIIEKGPKG